MKKFLFWFVSLTWGSVLTAVGLVASLFLIITGHKPHKFHYFIYFKVGKQWGGLNLGPIFIICKSADESTVKHEMGHGFQNIILGPLTPILVSIPSAIRYWYREFVWRTDKHKYYYLPDYDAIWFERWATYLGNKYTKEVRYRD